MWIQTLNPTHALYAALRHGDGATDPIHTDAERTVPPSTAKRTAACAGRFAFRDHDPWGHFWRGFVFALAFGLVRGLGVGRVDARGTGAAFGATRAAGDVTFDCEEAVDVISWYVKQIQGTGRTAFPCGWGQNLSKAMLDGLLTCPAQWFLAKEAGGVVANTQAQGFGNVVLAASREGLPVDLAVNRQGQGLQGREGRGGVTPGSSRTG